MVGDADVAYLALFLGLQHGLIKTGAVIGLGTEGRIVELIDIYIVRLKLPQALFKVLPEAFRIGGSGLGADDDAFPCVFKGCTQLFLTVAVGSRSIVIIDAVVKGLLKYIHRLLLRSTLYRKGSEAIFIDIDAGFPQYKSVHLIPP